MSQYNASVEISLSLSLSLSLFLSFSGGSVGPSATLLDLMNEVSTATNQWENIAIQLDIPHTDIERIKLEEPSRIQDCFRKIFTKWESKMTPPFTWPVIIHALESPAVKEFRLATQLKVNHLKELA